MAKLGSPTITVSFTELGISAINRGSKGVVGIILRDEAAIDPVVLTQSTQIPTNLGVANQEYVSRTFLGYVNPPKKVIVYTTTQADTNLKEALTWFEGQSLDYIVGPADVTAEESAAIAAWAAAQRQNARCKVKPLLPAYKADKYYVVNFTGEGMKNGAVTYTAAEYCSRMAGLLAGTPMRIAATYAPLSELSDAQHLTKEKADEKVDAGELFVFWDGVKVKCNRAVTSLVTTSQGMLDSFKKIKIVEIMDLIRTDIVATAEDDYIGKYANTYDNKMLLVTAIRGYFMGLERDQLVQPGYTVDIDVDAQEQWLVAKGVDTSEMSEQEIREADTGSHVFLKISCKILDAIEDIDIVVEI